MRSWILADQFWEASPLFNVFSISGQRLAKQKLMTLQILILKFLKTGFAFRDLFAH